MSKILHFPARTHVEIDGGIVTGGSNPAYFGKFVCFVTVITSDGGRLCEWDGLDYGEAVEAAQELARDWSGLDIRDRLRDSFGGAHG